MNRTFENYVRFEFDGEEAYVRKDRVNLLRDINAAIFDCDGVLIDIRGSYDRAITETVTYILERFTGYPFSRALITDEIIFLFRKSGGFNNDWDTCYGILMFLLCNLPKDLQEIFQTSVKNIDIKMTPLKRLLAIENASKGVKKILSETIINEMIKKLKAFADSLDKSGVFSVDRNLQNDLYGSKKDYYEDLKRILYDPPQVGGGVIPTVFEEVFCGSELFKEVYGMEPAFYNKRGLIDNGHVIIRLETLNRLSSIFGKANFGIASGSRLKTAKYALGDILSYFKSDASVFLDDVEREEGRIMRISGHTVNLKKPNVYSLLKAAKGLMPFKGVLCVGDSIEDALMAEEARKEDARFMFAGVYRYSGFRDALLQSFLKTGADMVLPSVNEIPLVLEELKGRS